MEESVKCECGNTEFWCFWDRVRCPKCLNEYKQTEMVYREDDDHVTRLAENWVRRLDNETHEYGRWHKAK